MPQDNALTPRAFRGPSNDAEHVNSRSFAGERGAKISAAHKRRTRPQRVGVSGLPWVLDEDFDDLEV